MQKMTPLIVGAGPVGLGAAFLIRRAGIATRIVDQAVQPAAESKALAVNPRTLELLESSGITQEMLDIGVRVVGVRIQFDAKRSAQIPLDSLQHKYPFMLARSQATTERLLGAGLKAAGGNVERGTELLRCWNNGGLVEAELKHGDIVETVQCSWLLAADGAHSAARKSLNIPFNGDRFEKPWHLADIPLKTGLEENLAHVFFRDHGQFIFMIRVVDEHSEQSVALNQSSVTRLLRSFFLSSMTKTPFIRNKFLAAVTGLDHQVEIERT
jgi:2-polyprenyl-6-methoxyphenol hydroxylase-like FAD-dependent oxidoreductase